MNNLQTRLILSFALVILVTLCGVSTIFSILIIRNPQQERITYLTLNTQARSLIAVLKRLPDFNPNSAIQYQLLEDLSQRQDIRVAWANSDMQVTYDSARIWDIEPGINLFDHLQRNTGQRWTGRIRDTGRSWLVVAHPMSDPPNVKHYLILAQPLTRPIATTIQQLRETVATPLLQAGAIALAIGIILSITISRSIAKPLLKVSEAAQALADGKYGISVQTEGPEEIKHLAEVFNGMAKQIQASQQAQNDLVANVAHDLRTPLTSIQGYAQALIDGTADTPENRSRAAQTIYEESRRMDKIAKTLLDLSKFQAGEIKLEISPVDIIEITQERMDFYQKQVEDAELSIEMISSQESIIVQADRERLIQVLDNLLSNAIAYTKPGGQITIETAVDESWLKMAISDTGVGIPKHELPRIFERFYRSDKSRQGSGTGLGLSILSEIISAHKGTVNVESIEGVGSKFTVRLPIADSSAQK